MNEPRHCERLAQIEDRSGDGAHLMQLITPEHGRPLFWWPDQPMTGTVQMPEATCLGKEPSK